MYNVEIDGKPVAYLKRVKNYRMPYIRFVGDKVLLTGKNNGSYLKCTIPAVYSENVAKGWVTTLNKARVSAVMVEAK